jgi:hypothetical protein
VCFLARRSFRRARTAACGPKLPIRDVRYAGADGSKSDLVSSGSPIRSRLTPQWRSARFEHLVKNMYAASMHGKQADDLGYTKKCRIADEI